MRDDRGAHARGCGVATVSRLVQATYFLTPASSFASPASRAVGIFAFAVVGGFTVITLAYTVGMSKWTPPKK